jgi:itaconate CoA-transferase
MEAVPGLGQHTDGILQELGWSVQAIAKLHQEGAV